MPQRPVVRSVTSIAHYGFCELDSMCDALKKTLPTTTLLKAIDPGVIHAVPLILVFMMLPMGCIKMDLVGFVCSGFTIRTSFVWLFHEIEITGCKYLQFQCIPLIDIQ